MARLILQIVLKSRQILHLSQKRAQKAIYHIIINIPSTKLSVYDEDELVMELPVAVGQAIYKTPTGYNEIKELIWNPWWYPPNADWAKDEEITPPGPANPLGPVKIVLGDEIRIHGT